ncbi:MAG: hypothetical protein AB1428_15510 [Bacteroidota bacterium]
MAIRHTLIRLAVGLSATVVVALAITAASAANPTDIFPPTGNSSGSAFPSQTGNYCFTQQYNWDHSLGYSIETFSSPKRIQFKYVDFYDGDTTLDLSVDYRLAVGWLVDNTNASNSLQLTGFLGYSFYVYDVTLWP